MRTLEGKIAVVTGGARGLGVAYVGALAAAGGPKIEVSAYREHSLGSGAEANAIAYIQVTSDSGKRTWGAAVDSHIELASIRAIISAINRSLPLRPQDP